MSLASSTTTNTATLEASGGGTLDISSNETVNNTGGTIEALTGSTVLLEGTVNGGTLKTSGTGVIESENGTLDGTVNVPTNTGKLNVAPAFDLFLQGTVNNTGTITLTGHGCIILNQPTILTGTGKVILGSGNCIFGSGNSLTNESTIEGAGTIGDSNPMPITNDGTIMANNKTTPLNIVPNSTGFTNNGKLTVNSGSSLIINSVGGPFNNLVGGTLTGGTYTVTGMLELGSAITTNAASITLTGPSAEILNTPTSATRSPLLGANATTGSTVTANRPGSHHGHELQQCRQDNGRRQQQFHGGRQLHPDRGNHHRGRHAHRADRTEPAKGNVGGQGDACSRRHFQRDGHRGRRDHEGRLTHGYGQLYAGDNRNSQGGNRRNDCRLAV